MTNDSTFQPFSQTPANPSGASKPKNSRPKQRVTARALLDIKRPSDPQVHPDGQRVAFVVTEADFDESRYVSHLWLTEHLLPETPDEDGEDEVEEEASKEAKKEARQKADADTNKSTASLRRAPENLANAARKAASAPYGGVSADTDPADAENSDTENATADAENGGGHDPTRQLTFSGDGETQPRWSPEGRYLAFLSSRLDETEPAGDDDAPLTDQVWVLPIDGGEARKLTSAKEGVLDYAWVHDTETVVYLAPEPRPRPLESLRRDERGRRKVDPIVEQDDRLRRQLWRIGVDDSKPKLLYGGDRGLTDFAVSPDGRLLAFTTNYTGEGNDYHLADLYVRWLESGKTCRLVARAGGKYHLRWSPDSRQLAFLSWYDPQLSYSRECVFVADVPAEPDADASLVYGADAPALTECRLLTDLDYDIAAFEWAHREEPEDTEDTEDADDTDNAPKRGEESAHDTGGRRTTNTRSALRDEAGRLEAQEAEAVLSIAHDRSASEVSPILVYALAAVRTGAELVGISSDNDSGNAGETGTRAQVLPAVEAAEPTALPTDAPRQSASANALVERYDMARDPGSDALAYIQESASALPEVVLRDADGFAHILTKLNADFTANYLLPRQEVVSWTSDDGLLIEGVLTYPISEEKGTDADSAASVDADSNSSMADSATETTFLLSPFSFPLIVQIHGGPKGRSANTLQNYSMAPVWAAEGYAVLRPNFRGSEGYGNAFAIANRRDLGGGDFRDIMAGVDHVVKMGVADPDRLGVMGGSYGGYMTNWVIGHTDRFKGAVSMFGIFHLQTDYSNSELSRWENDYLGGYYWQDPEIYRRLSPGSYVEAIKTPTLIIHGDDDTNTFISNSKELYQALRHRGVTTQFVHYPREGHGVREPNHKLDEVRRCLAWMDKHVRHAGQTPAQFRIGDRVPDPAGAMELNVQRAEIATFTGQPKPKTQGKTTQSAGMAAGGSAAPVLLEVAFTLHHLDTRPPVSALTFDLSNVRLELKVGQDASDNAPTALLPIGVPLDTLGGKVLIEGDNLRTMQQPDPDTGQLAFGCAVVFRVAQDGGEGLLRVADFPPVALHWSGSEDEDDENASESK